MKRFYWTPELDAELIALIGMRLTSREAARRLGVPQDSVKKRSARLGVRFKRWGSFPDNFHQGHVAADARSAELLRQAGVQI